LSFKVTAGFETFFESFGAGSGDFVGDVALVREGGVLVAGHSPSPDLPAAGFSIVFGAPSDSSSV
jgi:hypothetical protein